MPPLGERIRTRRHELGLTVQALADAVGCTRTYLSQIENDRRDSPPSEALLRKLEKQLRLEPESLVRGRYWETAPEEMKRVRATAELLRHRGIDELYRTGELQSLVDRLSGEAGAMGRVAMTGMVPLINRMMAGPFAEFTDLGYPARVADEYISVPGVSDPDAFAARVFGDSMEPTYAEGDIVVFSPLTQVRDGSDCFVRLEHDDESTFKRVYFEGERDETARVRLQPLNNRYPPKTFDREAIAAMYPAVYVMRAVGGG
ncbi:MAG: S24 family peptidase [Phycisphaerales bacterium]